jgi:hypothetical protein
LTVPEHVPAPEQAMNRDAVIYNVETFLGWVSDTGAVCAALAKGEAAWKKLR